METYNVTKVSNAFFIAFRQMSGEQSLGGIFGLLSRTCFWTISYSRSLHHNYT